MGLMKMLGGLKRRFFSQRQQHIVRREIELGGRKCRFEVMEERRVMNADPLHVGVVYIEEDGGSDLHGDTFEVTFTGGAPNTEMTRLVIDTNKLGIPGYQVGDLIFDTEVGGLGADQAFAFQIMSQTGIQSVQATVVDGGTSLILDLQGFHAGDKLVFQIDVDEVQEAWAPGNTNFNQINEGIDPITSGVEFQGSTLTASFVAAHYQNAQGTAEFRNVYDANFAGKNLNLPADDFNGKRDRTTGGVATLQQTPKPISIAGTVYHDQDLDLTQDAGDSGIGNVTLALWKKDAGGNYVFTGFTTKTDAQGNYRFGEDLNLMPGTYQVRETQPDGYFTVGATPGTVAGAASGSVQSGNKDILTEISIPLGDTDAIDYDFAEAQPASINGYVYADRNNNGIKEAGEVGLAGVTIQVIPLNTIAAQGTITVTTDQNGFYQVTGLVPGTYRVVEVNQPAGYFDGLDTVGTVDGVKVGTVTNPGDSLETIFLGGNKAGVNYNFGELEPGSIRGRVHLTDKEGNCFSAEALARPIAGATVILRDGQGNILKTTQTNANGEYVFDNLAPGTYVVQEITPDGLIDGGDHVGTIGGNKVGSVSANDVISGIVIKPGDNGVSYDFCEHEPAELCGNVYYDANYNGVFDAGEQGIAGATVRLYDATGTLVATQVTDANGAYCFTDLVKGTYKIVEQQPTGYLDHLDTAGTLGGNALNPGDEINTINVLWGDNGDNYNFGEVIASSIEGIVYVDPNGNCIYETGEAPIAGVTVQLLDAQGRLIGTTTTDSNGRYKFEQLRPGTYTVKELQPAGYLQGGQTAGSGGGDATQRDVISTINIGSGVQLVDYNFCEILPSTLAGRVYSDPNEDCVFNAGDTPLAGVRIDLYDGNDNLVATTFTDANGMYKFENLQPGEYTVIETQPLGYFNGGAVPGSGGGDISDDCGCGHPWEATAGTVTGPSTISHINIPGGVNLTEYNFCEVPPAILSGYVYQDGAAIVNQSGLPPENLRDIRDGILTADDTRLGGVWLELRDGLSGEPIRGEDMLPGMYPPGPIRVQTNANGYYEFKGLRAGNYAVYQVQPKGYFDGIDHEGSTLGIAVNYDSGLDPQFLSTFAELPTNDAIVRIPLGAGQHSQTNNFSEVLVTRNFIPPPPPNPPMPPLQPLPPFVFPNLQALPLPLLDLNQPASPYIDGGGMPSYTWHLSVINSGAPRGEVALVDGKAEFRNASYLVDRQDWVGVSLTQGEWQLKRDRDGDGQDDVLEDEPLFGLVGAIPLMGDFNGDGIAEKALFFQGEWFVDINGNGRWDDEDLWAKLGGPQDLPVVGDWDGDGKDDIGIFGPEWPGDPEAIEAEPGLPDPHNQKVVVTKPKNLPPDPEEATLGHRLLKHKASGKSRADLIDHVFRYGSGNDKPVAGDWNGDGINNIGIFRDGQWYLDTNGDGRWSTDDAKVTFGQKGDLPVVGDWDGNGVDEIGVYRSGEWIVDSNNNRELDAADKVFQQGGEGYLPVVGDVDGDGTDDAGLYRDVEVPAVREARKS